MKTRKRKLTTQEKRIKKFLGVVNGDVSFKELYQKNKVYIKSGQFSHSREVYYKWVDGIRKFCKEQKYIKRPNLTNVFKMTEKGVEELTRLTKLEKLK